MSILDSSNKYKFWYDYIKPKQEDRANLCYTDTDSFIIHIITEGFFEYIAGDVKKWFDTSMKMMKTMMKMIKDLFPIGMNKRVYGFFKDE